MHTLEIDEEGIRYDRFKLSLPFAVEEFENVFSATRKERVPLRLPNGDRELRFIMISDDCGIYYFRDESPPLIPSLSFCLFAGECPHSLGNSFPGHVTYESHVLDSSTTPEILKKNGLTSSQPERGGWWTLKTRDLSLTLMFAHPLLKGIPSHRRWRLSQIAISCRILKS